MHIHTITLFEKRNSWKNSSRQETKISNNWKTTGTRSIASQSNPSKPESSNSSPSYPRYQYFINLPWQIYFNGPSARTQRLIGQSGWSMLVCGVVGGSCTAYISQRQTAERGKRRARQGEKERGGQLPNRGSRFIIVMAFSGIHFPQACWQVVSAQAGVLIDCLSCGSDGLW